MADEEAIEASSGDVDSKATDSAASTSCATLVGFLRSMRLNKATDAISSSRILSNTLEELS